MCMDVCVCACEVLHNIHTNLRTSLRTYRNKRKCVSLYTHMCICYIHTRISSHRVCCFLLQCCCFASFSFSTITTRSRIRYRNAFPWFGWEGRRETALVGKSSSDTQTFAESTSTTSCLCFEYVQNTHTYTCIYVFMYTHTYGSVFLRRLHTPLPPHSLHVCLLIAIIASTAP